MCSLLPIWPTEVLACLFVCAGTEWLVPKSPVAFHSLACCSRCASRSICEAQSLCAMALAIHLFLTGRVVVTF